MNRIVKSVALSTAAACAGLVLVGASPSQAAHSHHHKAATATSVVQVQFKQSTITLSNGTFCVTFFRTRTSTDQRWVDQPWQIGPAAEGACGTPV